MEIGIWGDSITYGGSKEGWVGLLREFLAGQEINFYNRGICRDTTKDVRNRFEVESTAIAPEIIIFAIGTNDSKYPKGSTVNKVSLEEFKENINSLVTQARTKAKRVLLVGLTEVEEVKIDSSSKFKNDEIRKYDSYIKEFSKSEGLEFISMQGILDPSKDLEDGLHPNSEGYRKMFEVISSFFK